VQIACEKSIECAENVYQSHAHTQAQVERASERESSAVAGACELRHVCA